MSADTMQAAVVDAPGATPRPSGWPAPESRAGQALVRVTAASLNPLDLLISSGGHPAGVPPMPHVPGVEGAGVVVAAPSLPAGTRVRFQALGGFTQGALAERIAVDETACVPVPDGLDDATAAAIGVVGVSALVALRDRAALEAGQRVLVLGATGAFGRMFIQLARLLGAGHIAAAGRSPQRLEALRDLGADEVMALDALTGTYDTVVDPLWGPSAAAALGLLAPGGLLLNVGQAAGPTSEIAAGRLRHAGARIAGFSGTAIAPGVAAAAYQEVTTHAAAGRLVLECAVYRLADVAQAWKEQSASPGAQGRRRTVGTPCPTSPIPPGSCR